MSDVNFEADPTGEGLVHFLDFAIEKGHLKAATGQAMKSAVKEILSATQGEDEWRSVELDSLDIEDIQRRFETLRAMKFSGGSLGTYKSRFRKSLDMFNDFRASPSTWRPSIKQRDRKTKAKATPSTPGETRQPARTPPPTGHAGAPAPASSHRPSIITYPFPIRDGVLGSLELPADLTKREAERVAAFVASLAVDEARESGTSDRDQD